MTRSLVELNDISHLSTLRSMEVKHRKSGRTDLKKADILQDDTCLYQLKSLEQYLDVDVPEISFVFP